MITYNFEGIKRPEFLRRLTSAWIRLVAARHGKKVGDITYLFCSEEKMLETNQKFLQHDYYTDIITFDNSEGDTISGDIIIAPDTVRSNAAKYGTHFRDEFRRVIIHGILHLCGIDDKAPGAEGVEVSPPSKKSSAGRNHLWGRLVFYDSLYSRGERPVLCLKYLPKTDCVEKFR